MSKKAGIVVAEIYLYGIQTCGQGWIARTIEGNHQFGDGIPVLGRNMTSALWLALEAVEAVTKGKVLVFEPMGRFMAEIQTSTRPYFGDIQWVAAPHYVLSADDVIQASRKSTNAPALISSAILPVVRDDAQALAYEDAASVLDQYDGDVNAGLIAQEIRARACGEAVGLACGLARRVPRSVRVATTPETPRSSARQSESRTTGG